MTDEVRKGALVAYHGHLAVVVDADAKICIDVDGSCKEVRRKDVELLHPGPVKTVPAGDVAQCDLDTVVELMGGETVGFDDFVSLAYGDCTPGNAYAAYLLLQENVYFSGTPETGVRAYPREHIAAKLAERQRKAEERKRHAEFLDRVRHRSILDSDRPAIREIEEVARGQADRSKLMKELGVECSEEKAHRLLLDLGVWSYLDNPYPARFDIDMSPPPEGIISDFPNEPRLDLTHLESFAIDDRGADDPDDAISFDDGLVWVHIADPTALIDFESETAFEARRRGAKLYLPEGNVEMLPEWMTAKCALGLAEHSNALSFAIRIDGDGIAHLERISPSVIRVTRTSYDESRTVFSGKLAGLAAELERFEKRCQANGARSFGMPEAKLSVDDTGTVSISIIEDTRERRLVANAMIAAGAAVAEWAQSHDVALPVVTQQSGQAETDAAKSIGERLASVKKSKSSETSLVPGRHGGLGLDYYVRVTSPLRRYHDLI
ncbi:MAG: ribonuclease catalytic domain-containing protein, partial [Victivallaceae bacterium]|nr:ribonuclease catalytic domain-containing protein [Victivallaceae bacterium]